MTSAPFLREKIERFESFLNDRLREDLKKTLKQRDRIYAETGQYLQLKNTLDRLQEAEMLSSPLKTKMDLGCNFYANALIEDPCRVFVKLGLDVYLELRPEEAVAFVDRKVAHLEKIVSLLSREAANIKSRIKIVLEGLRELQFVGQQNEERKIVDFF